MFKLAALKCSYERYWNVQMSGVPKWLASESGEAGDDCLLIAESAVATRATGSVSINRAGAERGPASAG